MKTKLDTYKGDLLFLLCAMVLLAVPIRLGSENNLNREEYVEAASYSYQDLQRVRSKNFDKGYSEGYQKGAVDTYRLVKAIKKWF